MSHVDNWIVTVTIDSIQFQPVRLTFRLPKRHVHTVNEISESISRYCNAYILFRDDGLTLTDDYVIGTHMGIRCISYDA